MKTEARTKKGGAVTLNKKDGVWASYAVATVGKLPPSELLFAGAKLNDGRRIQFFLNRETNLIVVDVMDASGKGGCELLRKQV